MDEFLKRLLADGLVATDDAVEANRGEILARAAAASAAFGAQAKKMLGDAINSADLGFFGNPLKATLEKGVNEAIDTLVKEATADEATWLSQIVGAARAYAEQLNGG